MEQVHSVRELLDKAKHDDVYADLAVRVAAEMGAEGRGLDEALSWIRKTTQETNEAEVLEEINHFVD